MESPRTMSPGRAFATLVAFGLMASGVAWGASASWLERTGRTTVDFAGAKLAPPSGAVAVRKDADGPRLYGRLQDIAAAEGLAVDAGPADWLTLTPADANVTAAAHALGIEGARYDAASGAIDVMTRGRMGLTGGQRLVPVAGALGPAWCGEGLAASCRMVLPGAEGGSPVVARVPAARIDRLDADAALVGQTLAAWRTAA
jgi:hypothetical protein